MLHLIFIFVAASKNSWDIITMLVNVYGSKDMFVNEYKSLLADRLLSQASYFNEEKESRYLELLKMRCRLLCTTIFFKGSNTVKLSN